MFRLDFCQSLLAPRSRYAPLVIRVGLVVALAFGCVGVAAAQSSPKHATLRLEGRSGYHAPFFLALERGYYRDQGIDLEIFDGKGSNASIQVITNGTDTFGIANLTAVAIAASKGMPLLGLGALIQKSPDSIISLAGSNIAKPKDIEGKRGAFVPTGAGDRLFPAFAKANDIDVSKIVRRNVGDEARHSSLLQGNADFIIGWSFTDAYKINREKPIAPPILFSENGVTMLGAGIFTNKKVSDADPQLVKGFLAATAKGLAEALKDPNAAIEALMKARPDSDRDFMSAAMNSLGRFVHTPNTQSKQLLWMAKEDWDEASKNLVTYLDVPSSFNADAYYTNKYLPTP